MSQFDKDDYLKDIPDFDSLGPDSSPASEPSASADGSGRADGTSGSEVHAGDDRDAEGSSSAQPDSASARPDSGVKDVKDGVDAAKGASGSEPSAGSGAAPTPSKDGSDDAGSAGDSDSADDSSLTPLGQAKKEAADYLEALQRERAEFVNFRNRSAKEQERFRQHGIIDVLTALLPALDDIDRIREHSEMDDSFKAVSAKIDKAFERFGVEKFGEKGEEFDPTRHEAVLHRPDDTATKETVDAVVEAGYRIGDRVIRAARVVVASPKS